MSEMIELACLDCHEAISCGQHMNGNPDTLLLYTNERDIEALEQFIIKHLGHTLIATNDEFRHHDARFIESAKTDEEFVEFQPSNLGRTRLNSKS